MGAQRRFMFLEALAVRRGRESSQSFSLETHWTKVDLNPGVLLLGRSAWEVKICSQAKPGGCFPRPEKKAFFGKSSEGLLGLTFSCWRLRA